MFDKKKPHTNVYKRLQPKVNALQPNKISSLLQLCTVDNQQQLLII